MREPRGMATKRLIFVACVVALLLIGWCGVSFAQAAAAEEAPLWNLAWITDTECYWMGDGDYLMPLLEAVGANHPKMLLHTGDTSFEWANSGSWEDVLTLIRSQTPPIEFHLAPGNHDDEPNGALKPWLLRAASKGIYTLDTGEKVADKGYYKDHKTELVSGPEWPIWNPEVAADPHWQPDGDYPYHYVFERGGIRFIVCDYDWRDGYEDWLREVLSQRDDSSVTIAMVHNPGRQFPFDEVEGGHNVKLVLQGHHEGYKEYKNGDVTRITGAGIANGPDGESDAFTLWVYKDHLRLDRYVIPPGGRSVKPVENPVTVWTCEGSFSEYQRPELPIESPEPNAVPAGAAGAAK
jgi:predicted MPP superfamily phosphohydrolase